MTKSLSLVPATVPSHALTPPNPHSVIQSSLIVDRVISTSQFTLYTFVREDPRVSHLSPYARHRHSRSDGGSNAKDTAMITVNSRDHSTFKLSYWPKSGDAQIVELIRAEGLGRAIDDLQNAGFPCHAPAKTSGPVVVEPVALPVDAKSHTPLTLLP